MGIRAGVTVMYRPRACIGAGGHDRQRSNARNSFLKAVAARHGSRQTLTLLGGEDADCVVTGPTIAGANRGIYCCGFSPTVSNCHFLRNLSVGREGLADATFRVGGPKLAGDTKPTIANSIFAAYYVYGKDADVPRG
jgi:hypothetical protein